MAYRNPAFMVRHYGAEIGTAGITTGFATATGQGVSRLIDYRLATNMEFAAAETHWIQYDLGASPPPANRLIIPAGHNLYGNLVLKSGATSPPGTTRVFQDAPASLIDFSWSEVTARYWRLEFGQVDQWEIPELWLGQYQQLTTGPRPTWDLPVHTPAVIRSFATREAVLVSSPRRRRLALEHTALAGADLAIYDAVLANGVATPFYCWLPDDALATPILFRLTDDGERTQDHPRPQAALSYTVRLRALEQAS